MKREDVWKVLNAMIPLGNAGFPDERMLLTDEDVADANEAITILQDELQLQDIDIFEAWAAYVSLDLSKDAEGYYQSIATDIAKQAWFAAQCPLPVDVQKNLRVAQ